MNIRPEPLLKAYIEGHATGELITCGCGFAPCAGIYTDQAILLLDDKFLIIISDPLSVPPIEELPDYTFKNYVVSENEYREQVYLLAKQLVKRQHFFDYRTKYQKNYMRRLRILCSYVIQKHDLIFPP